MNPNYKLCSFNTSFLNDCHDIVLGEFLTDENEKPTRRIAKFSEAAVVPHIVRRKCPVVREIQERDDNVIIIMFYCYKNII